MDEVSLLDKFKNLFTDEEIVEVTKDIEIEPKKEAPKLPKVISAANRIANGNEAGTNVRAE